MHSGTDLLQFYDTDETLQNIAGYFMMEKVKFEDVKKVLLEKGISKFKWLWSIVVWKFGFYFWKEISAEQAL